MASKIKEKILDELTEMNSLTDSETKQNLLLALAEKISEQDDDRAIRNILWANRDLTSRMFTGPEFQVMPSVGEIMMSPAPSDTIDYEKEFGKDWYKNLENIPASKVQFMADKNGLDWKKVVDDMANKATAMQRDDIAHGRWDESLPTSENIKNAVGGSLMTLFGRRQQEAIARGDEPTAKDYVGDIAENSMYAVPWGRALGAAGAVAKGSKVASALTGPTAQYVIGNSTAPIASEAYDAAVYDEQNPRGQFNPGDIGTGIATNMAAPVIMQRLAGRYGTYIPFVKHMNQGGMIAAKSQGEIAADLARRQTPMSNAQRANTRIENLLRSGEVPKDNLYSAAAKFNADDKKVYDAVLKKIRNKEALTQTEWQYVNSGSHPELTDFYNLQYNPNKVPTGAQLAAEESVKNLITNEAPNVAGDESLPWYTRIPVAGRLYYNYAKEQEEAEKQRKKERDIEKVWNIRLGVK